MEKLSSAADYLGSVVIELCNSSQQRSPERNEFGSFTHFYHSDVTFSEMIASRIDKFFCCFLGFLTGIELKTATFILATLATLPRIYETLA